MMEAGAVGMNVTRSRSISSSAAPALNWSSSTARAPATAEDGDDLQIWELCAQLLDHGDIVESFEAGGTDVRATLREANDVFDLTDAEVRPDLVCDGPEVFRREKDERELRPVRQLNGDDISGADAEGAQVRGHPIHPGL